MVILRLNLLKTQKRNVQIKIQIDISQITIGFYQIKDDMTRIQIPIKVWMFIKVIKDYLKNSSKKIPVQNVGNYFIALNSKPKPF